jgi:Cu(I)/Ag(I) efflux system membrane fusion protein
VSGQFLVDSEANLKGALARLAAADEKAAGSDPHAGNAQAAAPAAKTHKAEGVVRGVGDEVMIRHGDIPSAGMGPMTMAYKAPPGGVPKDVKEGTHVRFEFVVTPQGEFALTSIAPLATGAKQ